MSVTYDNSAQFIGGPTAGTISFSITIAANSNRYAIVGIAIPADAGAGIPTTVTVGGSSASSAITAQTGTGLGVYVYTIAAPSSGSVTVSVNGLTNGHTYEVVAYSYYNVSASETLDNSNFGSTHTTASQSTSMTPTHDACLVWSMGMAVTASGTVTVTVGGSNQQTHSGALQNLMAAGDYGIVTPAASKTVSASTTDASFSAAVAIVSLSGGIPFTLTAATGSFTQTGFAATLTKAHAYLLSTTSASFVQSVFAATLTWFRYWTNATKDSSSFSNSSKAATPAWTNGTKDVSSFTNSTKH